jgi:hypothetical protein
MDPGKGTTRSEHRSERAQKRKAARTSRGLGYELAFLPRLYASPLKFAGLLKVQAHCPRPERLLGHRAANNPGNHPGRTRIRLYSL